MERGSPRSTRKRPVNLTLSEDLVTEAKGVTDNLSAVVETLLGEPGRDRGENQSYLRHFCHLRASRCRELEFGESRC